MVSHWSLSDSKSHKFWLSVEREIDSHHEFWQSVEFWKVYGQKKIDAIILFVNFSKAFHTIHSEKMEQILLAFGLPKETDAAIMMLYKNSKVKARSMDRDTDYFDIVAGALQGDTLAPYLFIIRQDYVLRMSIDLMKENGFKLTKERSRRYPAQTITAADHANYIALPTNTPAQAETLLHSLKQAVGGIGLHVNANKTEYMCFNQRGDIFTRKGGPLKLVNKFTYLGSCVSSTEKDINQQRHGQLPIGYQSYGSQTWMIE